MCVDESIACSDSKPARFGGHMSIGGFGPLMQVIVHVGAQLVAAVGKSACIRLAFSGFHGKHSGHLLDPGVSMPDGGSHAQMRLPVTALNSKRYPSLHVFSNTSVFTPAMVALARPCHHEQS